MRHSCGNPKCDNPNCGGIPEKKWLRKDIKKYGVAVLNIFPGECKAEPWFHYTVGLHGVGLPELLTIGGHSMEVANDITSAMTKLAAIMRERKIPFSEGELVDLGGKYPVKITNPDMAAVWEHCPPSASRVFHESEDIVIQQMLIPDREGRFPGDPKCAEPYASFRVPPAYPGTLVLN